MQLKEKFVLRFTNNILVIILYIIFQIIMKILYTEENMYSKQRWIIDRAFSFGHTRYFSV